MYVKQQAYLILAHRNPSQVAHLLRLLDSPLSDIYLCVDSSSPEEWKGLESAASEASVTCFPSPDPIGWGDSSIVEAELALLKMATRTRHGHYHLLSGQDLPLMPPEAISDYCTAHPSTEFVSLDEFGTRMSRVTRERLSLYHPFQRVMGKHQFVYKAVARPVQRLFGVNRTGGTALGKGSQWFTITDQFAHFLVENNKQEEKWIAHSFCSDEMMVQTALLNSPFLTNLARDSIDTVRGDNRRFILWSSGSSSPATLSVRQARQALSSGKLFARKFDLAEQPEAYRLIEKSIVRQRALIRSDT
jgi:hypothetical protein